jgi:hypothetical protein
MMLKESTLAVLDEHSHIAISSGVNEWDITSAEVTIQDVVNSDDVNIYRELAGGVTTSQLLHGSTNPYWWWISNCKMEWGAADDEMLYKNQPGFIKFGRKCKTIKLGN